MNPVFLSMTPSMTGEPDKEQTMDADILVMISLNRVEFFIIDQELISNQAKSI